ncbi:MAG TPA: host attachment protein [Verrucomicrobia bacterium]|nr:host attachment protein [Verrucomicrobiota bacterium]HOB31567.1 host attachment protein [Verrucomicrobiota bacterium]HOP96236.1 host attachment protein [Verrucomicrobiota bacterium]
MRNTWIVVTDLEELKAYRVDSDPLYSNPRLELVDHARTTANRRLVEEVTDQAGRFPRTGVGPNGVGGMARGERHNMELEKRKRCIRKLADHLNSLLRSDEVERCFLAASREIHNALLQEIDPRLRAKVEVDVAADLTNVPKSELLGYFKSARTAAHP